MNCYLYKFLYSAFDDKFFLKMEGSELDNLINQEGDYAESDILDKGGFFDKLKSKIFFLVGIILSPIFLILRPFSFLRPLFKLIKWVIIYSALVFILLYSALSLLFLTRILDGFDSKINLKNEVLFYYTSLSSVKHINNIFSFMYLDKIIEGGGYKSKESGRIEAPSWDTSHLLNGKSESVAMQEMKKLVDESENLRKKFNGKLKNINSPELYELTSDFERIILNASNIAGYFFLKSSTSQSDKECLAQGQLSMSLMNKIISNFQFFTTEVSDLNQDKLNGMYIIDERLKKYIPFFDVLIMNRKYNLSSEIESFLSQTSVVDDWHNFYTEFVTSNKTEYNGKQLSIEQLMSNMKLEDREVRKSSFIAASKLVDNNFNYFAQMLNSISKYVYLESSLRGAKEYLDLLAAKIQLTSSFLKDMNKRVEASYPEISHRFYKIKSAVMFGSSSKKIKSYDLNAPIKIQGVEEKTYSWDEAKEIVINSYSSFSKDLGDIAKMLFEKNLIDASVKEGKVGGGFCASFGKDKMPYILMNFRGSLVDVFTLAHEVGHAIHKHLSSQSQTQFSIDPSEYLAEIASMFGERILFDYMMQNTKHKREKIHLLFFEIFRDISSVFRQNSFFSFEMKVQEVVRKNGSISASEIQQIWEEENEKMLGNNVDIHSIKNNVWPYIGHFFYKRYYVGSYVFSGIVSSSLFKKYKNSSDKNDFVKKYKDFLSSGESKSPRKIFESFGFKMDNGSIIEEGLSSIKNNIATLEKELIETSTISIVDGEYVRLKDSMISSEIIEDDNADGVSLLKDKASEIIESIESKISNKENEEDVINEDTKSEDLEQKDDKDLGVEDIKLDFDKPKDSDSDKKS